MNESEDKILKKLYASYKQEETEVMFPSADLFRELEIPNGTTFSFIFSNDLVRKNNKEELYITKRGRNYMKKVTSLFGKILIFLGINIKLPLTEEVDRAEINWTKWGTIFGGLGIVTMIVVAVIVNQDSTKPKVYISTQTVYENKPTTPYEYLDLDGKGQLVPLPFETVEAAIQFGEAKGEENKIYMHRVVVMALDPSVRYTEGNILGNTFKPAYDPNKLYTFYLQDGTDITDENASINIIPAGEKIYKVKLLSIDGRKDEHNRMGYTFRVEEIIE